MSAASAAPVGGPFSPPGDRAALPCGPPDLHTVERGSWLAFEVGAGILAAVVIWLAARAALRARQRARTAHQIRPPAAAPAGRRLDGRPTILLTTLPAAVMAIALLTYWLVHSAAITLVPAPEPVSDQQIVAAGVTGLRFDSFDVPVDGAVATCDGENNHRLSGEIVGQRPDGVGYYAVSHVRGNAYYLQGKITVRANGTWEIPVTVNEDGTYYRRPVWMTVIAARAAAAAALDAQLVCMPDNPDKCAKMSKKMVPAGRWQVLAKIRVAKFPNGFRPFGSWSAW